MAVSAGRILIMPKGNYNSLSSYDNLDLVNYDGNSWLCKKTCTGITPSDTNSTYWQRFGASLDVDTVLSTTSTNPVQNKVITNEFNHQSTEMLDIKMLGWSVPRECPIQNEMNGNQFTQKVGRVDAGSLSWEYIQQFTAFRFASNNKEYIKYGIKQNTKLYLDGFNYIGVLPIWMDIKNADEKSIAGVWAGGVNDGFIIKSTTYTDTASFKQAMQGQYLYYELATPITTTIDGNEIGETVSDVRKETTVNLLNPTLQTTTQNGVTCTNNGDGTYTLKGTASRDTYFIINSAVKVEIGKKYKLCCTTSDDYSKYNAYLEKGLVGLEYKPLTASSTIAAVTVTVRANKTLNNVTIKPMLTTNLDATYDDFVPYTGDTGRLNRDVASLLKRIQALESQFASETSELCSDAIDDLASVVSTQDEAIDELATIVTESEEK